MTTAFRLPPSLRAKPGGEATLTARQRRALSGARSLAHLFDDKFNVLGFRFGIESIVGLIPVVGDTVSGVASIYLIGAAINLRLPPAKIAQIVALLGLDFAIGLIPFIGDLADMVFKAHIRSVRIIEGHVLARAAGRRP